MMEVPAAGMAALPPDRAVANSGLPLNLPAAGAGAAAAGDSVAALLTALSQSDLTRLLPVIEGSPGPAGHARVEELVGAAADAVAAGNLNAALDAVRQIGVLHPARAEVLPSVPALAPIRPALEQLLGEMTAAARLHAEGRLADATRKIESVALQGNPACEFRAEIALLVADKLIQAGGLPNFVRSAALSTAVIEQLPWVPAAAPVSAPMPASDRGILSEGWVIPLWVVLGIVAVGLCWWLRDDYLPQVCGIWVGMLALLVIGRFRPGRGLR
jgi:hypothetical protein